MAASSPAPARSILLTNAMRGTPCRSACRHTDSLRGSTPATASNTATAPSRTRSERSTSSAKSTCPGVSIRLIRCPSQVRLTAAAKTVTPRSRSCGSKSVTVEPPWTSPRWCVVPVTYRIRSVTVVLPASTWARIPRLRTAARGLVYGESVCGESVCIGLRTARGLSVLCDGAARFPDGTCGRAAGTHGRQDPSPQTESNGRQRFGLVTASGTGRAAGTGRPRTRGAPRSGRTGSGERLRRCGHAWPTPLTVSNGRPHIEAAPARGRVQGGAGGRSHGFSRRRGRRPGRRSGRRVTGKPQPRGVCGFSPWVRAHAGGNQRPGSGVQRVWARSGQRPAEVYADLLNSGDGRPFELAVVRRRPGSEPSTEAGSDMADPARKRVPADQWSTGRQCLVPAEAEGSGDRRRPGRQGREERHRARRVPGVGCGAGAGSARGRRP
ncbi:hypothetical protein SAMN05216505_102538 [Streptomyces prasinopilosus]|uniref:Uncharacterized protein n=1 Tax=Streptomyces prasinopilosus TaxID=67344 RepID=A0A1G6MIN2_9ACTN|nr:hypothetical protein SAMN05216505_102538 [Streptomyces prasinopilosus]